MIYNVTSKRASTQETALEIYIGFLRILKKRKHWFPMLYWGRGTTKPLQPALVSYAVLGPGDYKPTAASTGFLCCTGAGGLQNHCSQHWFPMLYWGRGTTNPLQPALVSYAVLGPGDYKTTAASTGFLCCTGDGGLQTHCSQHWFPMLYWGRGTTKPLQFQACRPDYYNELKLFVIYTITAVLKVVKCDIKIL